MLHECSLTRLPIPLDDDDVGKGGGFLDLGLTLPEPIRIDHDALGVEVGTTIIALDRAIRKDEPFLPATLWAIRGGPKGKRRCADGWNESGLPPLVGLAEIGDQVRVAMIRNEPAIRPVTVFVHLRLKPRPGACEVELAGHVPVLVVFGRNVVFLRLTLVLFHELGNELVEVDALGVQVDILGPALGTLAGRLGKYLATLLTLEHLLVARFGDGLVLGSKDVGIPRVLEVLLHREREIVARDFYVLLADKFVVTPTRMGFLGRATVLADAKVVILVELGLFP